MQDTRSWEVLGMVGEALRWIAAQRNAGVHRAQVE